MLCAYIKSGGKQHRVSVGDRIQVEKIEAEIGSELILAEVLALVNADGVLQTGSPQVPNCSVRAEVIDQYKGEKIRIFKMRRRQNSRNRMGHRQQYTRLKILSIDQSQGQSKSQD
ncbi:MAG: 50S ribosomal protein L21 [Gammaproteobacteria bacterium]